MGKRLTRFAAGVALAIALLVSGCGGSSTETKISAGGAREISFLTMQLRPTFDAFLLPILKEFETAHPDVSLNWLDYPFQNYETKVVTSFLGGNAPDIINFASETIPSFTDAGHLLELDSLVPKDILDSYLPNVVEQGCRVKGKLYALPWYLAGAVSVYNKKILQEAGIDPNDIPRTYEDLPAFVAVPGEPKRAGIPVETEGELQAARTRYLLRNASWVRLE